MGKTYHQKEWKRSGRFDRHHIENKCKGGRLIPSNKLIFDTERHKAWHFLFQNKSFEEVAALLLRTVEIKQRYQ